LLWRHQQKLVRRFEPCLGANRSKVAAGIKLLMMEKETKKIVEVRNSEDIISKLNRRYVELLNAEKRDLYGTSLYKSERINLGCLIAIVMAFSKANPDFSVLVIGSDTYEIFENKEVSNG
jgi:hypothetical protein